MLKERSFGRRFENFLARLKQKKKKKKKRKKRKESKKIRRSVSDFVVSRDRFETFALTNDKKFNPINNPILMLDLFFLKK